MRMSRPVRATVLALSLGVASLMVFAAPSGALLTDFKGQFGAGTIPPEPESIVYSDSTSELYVGTSPLASEPRIYRFSLAGALLGEVEYDGGAIAVDNSAGPYAGDIYVIRRGYLERITPSGTPVDFKAVEPYVTGARITGTPSEAFEYDYANQIVVGPTGDLYLVGGNMVGHGKSVYVFDDEGEFLYTITPPVASQREPSAREVAIAPDGTIYIAGAEEANNVPPTPFVDSFNEQGEYQSALNLSKGVPGFQGIGGGLAVSSATDDVYVSVGSGFRVDKYRETEQLLAIDVFGPEGKYLYQIPESPDGGAFPEANSIAAAADGDLYFLTAEGEKYAYDGGGPPRKVVDIFSPTFVTVPDVTTGRASKVGHSSAVVSGTVSPDGFEATCSVEYGPAGQVLTSSVPCSPLAIGASEGVTAVEVDLSGLLPRSTPYEYRVCALNLNDILDCGQSQAFATLPDQPAVVEESVGFVTPTEALLNGTVNPETGATTYHFAYGPTAGYGLQMPEDDRAVGSGEAPLPVEGVSIGALRPGTTYHYALVATNAAGTTYGPDRTFTTPPAPVPRAATGAATGISQNGVTLTGTVDPDGVETSYEFDLGTDTAYGTRVFASAESGTEPVNVSAVFASLAPGTTYHYRLVASNEFGTSYGPDETFTTPGFPTSVLGYPATLGLVAMPPIVFPAAKAAAPEPVSPSGRGKRAAKGRGKRKKGKGKGKGRKSSVGSGRARRGDRGRSGK